MDVGHLLVTERAAHTASIARRRPIERSRGSTTPRQWRAWLQTLVADNKGLRPEGRAGDSSRSCPASSARSCSSPPSCSASRPQRQRRRPRLSRPIGRCSAATRRSRRHAPATGRTAAAARTTKVSAAALRSNRFVQPRNQRSGASPRSTRSCQSSISIAPGPRLNGYPCGPGRSRWSCCAPASTRAAWSCSMASR